MGIEMSLSVDGLSFMHLLKTTVAAFSLVKTRYGEINFSHFLFIVDLSL